MHRQTSELSQEIARCGALLTDTERSEEGEETTDDGDPFEFLRRSRDTQEVAGGLIDGL